MTGAFLEWPRVVAFAALILALGCDRVVDTDPGIVDENRDECSGRSKVALGGPVIESHCEYVADLGNGDSGYRCSCNVALCAGGDQSGGGAGGASSVAEEGLCDLVRSVEESPTCDAALQDACGVRGGDNGFCSLEYSRLSPTHEGQERPPAKTVECIEGVDGTHTCSCGEGAELVDSPEGDCLLAAYAACQTTCASDLGECTPNGYGYDCSCNVGFEWTTELSASCEDTLHIACAPRCEKAYDACYANETGELYYCTCGVSPEVHEVTSDPNGSGEQCLTPLIEACGSSGED